MYKSCGDCEITGSYTLIHSQHKIVNSCHSHKIICWCLVGKNSLPIFSGGHTCARNVMRMIVFSQGYLLVSSGEKQPPDIFRRTYLCQKTLCGWLFVCGVGVKTASRHFPEDIPVSENVMRMVICLRRGGKNSLPTFSGGHTCIRKPYANGYLFAA